MSTPDSAQVGSYTAVADATGVTLTLGEDGIRYHLAADVAEACADTLRALAAESRHLAAGGGGER